MDTGALVALLKRDEQQHKWAVEAFKRLPAEGMVSCEAVVSACFLLARNPMALDGMFGWFADRKIRLDPLDADSTAVHHLIKRYRNVPASYADACLVRLSERHPEAVVVTTDSDFRIYRRNGRQAIPLLMPPD